MGICQLSVYPLPAAAPWAALEGLIHFKGDGVHSPAPHQLRVPAGRPAPSQYCGAAHAVSAAGTHPASPPTSRATPRRGRTDVHAWDPWGEPGVPTFEQPLAPVHPPRRGAHSRVWGARHGTYLCSHQVASNSEPRLLIYHKCCPSLPTPLRTGSEQAGRGPVQIVQGELSASNPLLLLRHPLSKPRWPMRPGSCLCLGPWNWAPLPLCPHPVLVSRAPRAAPPTQNPQEAGTDPLARISWVKERQGSTRSRKCLEGKLQWRPSTRCLHESPGCTGSLTMQGMQAGLLWARVFRTRPPHGGGFRPAWPLSHPLQVGGHLPAALGSHF